MPTARSAPKKSPATTRPNGNGKDKNKKKTLAQPAPDAVSIDAAPDQSWLLIALVLLGGMSSLAVEMVAARLMAPYFGDSQFVWATLIGLTLIYLTIGYALGGRLADRAPRSLALYQLTAVAAATIGLIPPLASVVLGWAAEAFGRPDSDITAGPLIAALVLFSLPVTLLGCVSPYAIRLRVKAVGTAGSTAGRLYALSTVGSILGTFVPVFWLMPHYGVRATIFLFAGMLMAISAAGMLVQRRSAQQH
ncbi:MAG TPA: fused MFS/spermidine synthase [Ktedonobacterales bacterium]|jgi:predicted membrane-bound spermidine synthase